MNNIEGHTKDKCWDVVVELNNLLRALAMVLNLVNTLLTMQVFFCKLYDAMTTPMKVMFVMGMTIEHTTKQGFSQLSHQVFNFQVLVWR